jgi:translation initiation factor 1
MARDRDSRTDGTRLVYSTAGGIAAAPKAKRPAPSTPAARGRGVRLRLDRRASDRVVTVVTGLALAPDALAALVRDLKTSCGAGGTVRDGAIELQGDHRATVESALAARGIKSKRAGG